jgi:hypothetical protein
VPRFAAASFSAYRAPFSFFSRADGDRPGEFVPVVDGVLGGAVGGPVDQGGFRDAVTEDGGDAGDAFAVGVDVVVGLGGVDAPDRGDVLAGHWLPFLAGRPWMRRWTVPSWTSRCSAIARSVKFLACRCLATATCSAW